MYLNVRPDVQSKKIFNYAFSIYILKPKYLDGVIYNPEKSEKVNFGKV